MKLSKYEKETIILTNEEDRYYMLSGKLNDVPSGRLFRADLGFLQMCQSL